MITYTFLSPILIVDICQKHSESLNRNFWRLVSFIFHPKLENRWWWVYSVFHSRLLAHLFSKALRVAMFSKEVILVASDPTGLQHFWHWSFLTGRVLRIWKFRLSKCFLVESDITITVKEEGELKGWICKLSSCRKWPNPPVPHIPEGIQVHSS